MYYNTLKGYYDNDNNLIQEEDLVFSQQHYILYKSKSVEYKVYTYNILTGNNNFPIISEDYSVGVKHG